ncbi:MAG: LuxR C-terminal-related transcriptional regulator [Lachnospiraceae bacterium]
MLHNPESIYSIKRKNINQILSADNTPQFVAFTASAGYGKSTAASAYLSAVNAKVIWVALTPLDNFFPHLWENIINSAQGVCPNLANELTTLGFPLDLAGMYQLINQLGRLNKQKHKYILVLDDYHIITENRIKSFFKDITNADISNLSIYVLSRETVDFLEDQKANTLYMTEKELAFSPEETQEYFSIMNIKVPDEVLFDIYYNKTQGWPFALYLIALSIKSHPAIIRQTMDFSNELLFETIDQVVFSMFSKEEQDFLLKLSLLSFYPKKLIEDVFDKIIPSHRNILSQNMFIQYNRHTNAYQFHQFFSDFLHSKLYLLDIQQKMDVLNICGNWYQQHNLIIDALNCFHQTLNYEKMWNLISDFFPNFITIDYAYMLLDVFYEFPHKFISEHPMIYQMIAILNLLSGNADKSIEKCEEYIEILKVEEDDADICTVIGELYLTEGFAYMYMGNTIFSHYFSLADTYLSGHSCYYGNPCMLILNGNPITLISGDEGELDSWINAIEKTQPLFDKLLNNNMAGFAPLTRGFGLYYQGQLKAAEEYAQKALYQSLDNEKMDMICQSYYLLLRLAICKGDYQESQKYLNIVSQYINNQPLLNIADITTAWFYAVIGLESCIPAWITSKTIYASEMYIQAQGFERMIRAHCMLSEGSYNELIAYMLSTVEIYHKYHKYIYLIYAHIILAIAYYKTNQIESFIGSFHTAYKLSYGNKIYQPFIELRNHSRMLLYNVTKLKAEELPDSKLQALLVEIDYEWLSILQRKAGTWTKMANTIRFNFYAANPNYSSQQIKLSKNEQEMLQYISNGLSQNEVAEFMNISPNTVKAAIRSIYSKLGAQNSAHAVHIAMQKGIIS